MLGLIHKGRAVSALGAFLCVFFSVSSLAQALPEQGAWLQQARDAASVSEAVDIVSSTLEGQGFEIALTVNHAAAAASVGLELRPTQVVFARPPRFVERRFLARSHTIGIDLPLKVLVFEDEDGAINLRINPIGYLTDRHDLPVSDWVGWVYRQSTEQFTQADDGLVTIESSQSVDDTAAALQAALAANGAFAVPLVIDYRARWQRSGPILVVFGNPNAGTPLMQTTQEVALDLPQKMLIWERHGQTFITWNDPFFVAKRHAVVGQDARLGAISNALANFAAAAAAQD
ncbi:MAG: DUF302 domain-containing protein [Gammaproteobacteria bacterium]